MFYGTYEHKVDSKGRMPIPARFRRALRGALILTKLADQCIVAYPPGEWEKLGKSLEGQAAIDRAKTRKLKRVIFGNAFSADLDEQGRVLLPPMLRQKAGIGDAVTIVGMDNYFEVWDQAARAKEDPQLEQDAWTLIESQESKP